MNFIISVTALTGLVVTVMWQLCKPRSQDGMFAKSHPCFLCKKSTRRVDGYCSDDHKATDLQTAAYRYSK